MWKVVKKIGKATWIISSVFTWLAVMGMPLLREEQWPIWVWWLVCVTIIISNAIHFRFDTLDKKIDKLNNNDSKPFKITNLDNVPIVIDFNGKKFKYEGEGIWPGKWKNKPKPEIDPIKDSARDIIFDNPTGFISDNPLFRYREKEAIREKSRKKVRIRMAKAIVELEAMAFCPPTAETQTTILGAKLLLKDAKNKNNTE